MKVKERAVLKIVVDALIESRKCLDIAHEQLKQHAGMRVPRVEESLDRSNRVIRHALVTLNDCDLL